jgi:tRNA dimethylallyltransferase
VPPILLLHGPTASGKTALAVALAQQLGAEVVNADALQVYADLAVLTARPTAAEQQGIPHHLFGTVDASERFSVGRWVAAVGPVLAAIAGRGKPAILVGGTGLYFKALTQGLAPVPPIDPEVRAQLAQRLLAEGPEPLHAELAQRDPIGALALAPRDGVRIVRALEVLTQTGQPLRSFTTSQAPLLAGSAWVGLALTPPRAWLYARINARFDGMVGHGALDEVAALGARGLDPALPAMKAHGVPWLLAHGRGEIGLQEAVALGCRDTRRYAKRQMTWIAHQAPGWRQIVPVDLEERRREAEHALALR